MRIRLVEDVEPCDLCPVHLAEGTECHALYETADGSYLAVMTPHGLEALLRPEVYVCLLVLPLADDRRAA